MRERIYRFLYDSKDKVLGILHLFSQLSAFSALCLIIYQNGFRLSQKETVIIHETLELLFGVFAINYFARLLYSFERIQFIKNTWFEGLVMVLITLTGLKTLLFDFHFTEVIFSVLKLKEYTHFYSMVITVSMLYLVGFELVRFSNILNSVALQPATTFILSFLILIALGTGLLMLPAMTIKIGGASFMEAVFTSVSASCVTGLIIVDTATFFTFKGQIVILILMQLGGIGIVSFTTFFATFLKSGVGIKQQLMIQDYLSGETLLSSKSLLRQVVFITLSIELLTFIGIYFSWGSEIQFTGIGDRIFKSLFHAVSAFCNAGFSIFTNGLYEESIRNSYLLHVIIGFAVIVGGLGFSVIQDVLSPKMLRERLEKPWKNWRMSSKIAIYTSAALILFGMILFYLIESKKGHVLDGADTFTALVASFFQSVTTRTAGFNTVDIGALATPTLIFMIFLMFIGASSGSTGGGIKTSTFLIIVNSSIATIRGKKTIDMAGRTISNDLLFKAYSIFVFSASYNLVLIFLLSISEEGLSILDLVFEQISAFATVGLSTGITASLSTPGKCLIILSMFVGRIGTLTLAIALSNRISTTNYKYPNAHLLIG